MSWGWTNIFPELASGRYGSPGYVTDHAEIRRNRRLISTSRHMSALPPFWPRARQTRGAHTRAARPHSDPRTSLRWTSARRWSRACRCRGTTRKNEDYSRVASSQACDMRGLSLQWTRSLREVEMRAYIEDHSSTDSDRWRTPSWLSNQSCWPHPSYWRDARSATLTRASPRSSGRWRSAGWGPGWSRASPHSGPQQWPLTFLHEKYIASSSWQVFVGAAPCFVLQRAC